MQNRPESYVAPKLPNIGEDDILERRYLKPTEVARIVRCHIQTVYRWIMTGKLPAASIGGKQRYRIAADDLEEMLRPMDTLPPITPQRRMRITERTKRQLAKFGIKVGGEKA